MITSIPLKYPHKTETDTDIEDYSVQININPNAHYATNRHVICIPKVSNKTTKQYIFSIFCSLKIGFIEKLTEVPICHDPLHKRIFVKIKWNQSNLSKYICNRFESGENVKVVYSEPWYWICVCEKSGHHRSGRMY
jgi:hypothetical protein